MYSLFFVNYFLKLFVPPGRRLNDSGLLGPVEIILEKEKKRKEKGCRKVTYVLYFDNP